VGDQNGSVRKASSRLRPHPLLLGKNQGSGGKIVGGLWLLGEVESKKKAKGENRLFCVGVLQKPSAIMRDREGLTCVVVERDF